MKQHIQIYDKNERNLLLVKCGILQESILGSLLFLIYINDLQFVSALLKPIMFADDTNRFTHTKTLMLCFLK